MQDKRGGSGSFLLQGVVKADLLPVRDATRLPLRQTRPHREVRFRKLQRIFQVLSHAE